MSGSYNVLMQKFYQVAQERGGSISDYLICVEGVLNDIRMKFPTWMTEMLGSRFYSGLCSQIWDGMRDMFRNSAYDVTALMKATQDLEDEHALDRGQQQVTAKATSVGDQGNLPQDQRYVPNSLSEAKSQMRAFTKEISAWILECKAWNPKCKLARAKNAQAGTGTGNQNCRGSQTHSNGQGRASQCQPAQWGAIENGKNKNIQENETSQNWPQTQSHQQCKGSIPMCYKCRGWGHISHNCPSTQNYTEWGWVKDTLNSQWGSRTKPPREQSHIQSASTADKSVRAPKYHNPDLVTQLIGPPNEARVEVNSVATYTIIDKGTQITMIA